jgi:hypothetical protein
MRRIVVWALTLLVIGVVVGFLARLLIPRRA